MARSGAEGTLWYSRSTTQRRKGSPNMKWHAINLYLKVVSLLGTVTALLLAAGAEGKWGK